MEVEPENQKKPEIKTLDMRGQICPSTLLSALREVNLNQKEIRCGNLRLVLFTDNRNAVNTIPDAMKNMGYHASVEKEAGGYRITVERRI